MRASRVNVLICSALLISALGCAFGQHMKSGDEAFGQGRYQVALTEYEAALAAKPESKEAADKARATKEKLVGEGAAVARKKLSEGDEAAAVAATATCLSLLPESEVVKTLAHQVSEAVQTRAAAAEREGRYAEGLALYEVAVAQLAPERPTLEPKAAAHRAAWASSLRTRAAEAEKAGLKAEALLAYGQIARLTADSAAATRRNALRGEVLAKAGFVVQLSGSKQEPGFASVLAALKGNARPPGLRIAGPDEKVEKVGATARVLVSRPLFDTTRSTRNATATYQSGTQKVDNPLYKQRQDKVGEEEHRLGEAEREVSRCEDYVQQYQGEVDREEKKPNVTTGADQNLYNAKSNLRSARERVGEARSQLQQARDALRSESQFRDEPVYSEHNYTITTHVLRGKARLEGAIELSDKRPKIDLAQGLETESHDDEHAAQPIAHLACDPLELASEQTLSQELYKQALQRVEKGVSESFAGFRRALLEQSKTAAPAGRLNLLVTYALTDPHEVDPAALVQLQSLSGVPDAIGLLTGP